MKSLEDRFFDKVCFDPSTDCWLWSGMIRSEESPYGLMKIKGKKYGAHRISWQIHFGEIPKDMLICHKCDVPHCVNPAHLFLGTSKDNVLDMIRKRRQHEQKKTHCPRGHEYNSVNTYLTPANKRKCRACHAQLERQRRKHLKKGEKKDE